MSTGSLVNNVCYETSVAASDAYFSSQPVLSFQDPVNILVHQVVKYEFIAPNWMRSVYGEAPWGSNLWSQTVAVSPVFPSCLAPSESYNQGLIFGSATAMLLLFAFATRAAVKVLG